MGKIFKTCSCPKCNSSNVTKLEEKSLAKEGHDKYLGVPCEEKIIEKTVKCICKHCGHEYTTQISTDRYVVLKEPCYMTCYKDIKLLAKYVSSSVSCRSYEIYSSSYYIKSNKMKETVYFMSIEDDNYPIFMSEKEAKEMVHDPEMALSFAYGIWMSRYR